MRTMALRIITMLNSRRFFQAVLVFFVLEASWIVLSAVYPMAFDEDFHFGLIKIYSHYWLPFLSSQPPNAAAYGAVARDPSYLYHYLMSFPYRLITLFIHGQTGQVIALRFINVGLFSGGLVLFRRVLLRSRLSLALTNVILLLFTLIPIAPQLAAHINYDNLLFPLVAWSCLLAFRLIDEIRARQPSARTVLTLLSVCLFASLVKYPFLPIFLALVLYLVAISFKTFRGQSRALAGSLWCSLRQLSRPTAVLLVGLCLLGTGMLVQRDGINLIRYHEIVPDCGQVIGVKACSAYSAWDFSYVSHQNVLASKNGLGVPLNSYNVIAYIGVWMYWMWYRLFFAVNGSASGFVNYPPLPLPSAAAAVIGIAGIVSVIVWRRRIFHNNPYLVLLLVVCLTYTLALLADGWSAYHYTNVLQTMNGRYLLPILLLAAAIVGRAFSLELKRAQSRKIILAVVATLLFLQGGGVLTFITRSDASWNWPNSTVVKVNDAARKLTKPVIIKGSKNYSTRVWFFN
jgi:hypothetical protein